MTTQDTADVTGIHDLLGGSQEPLVVATRGPVRFLIFNRPDARNAMSRTMRQEYARQMQAADADPAVDVVVVTGAHGYFSSGVDLKENPSGTIIPMVRPHPVEVTRAMAKPVLAMVDGPCVTGGLEVALSCGFIIASDRSRFVDTHIKIGRFPGWGLSTLLPAAIGMRRARQMQMTGEFIDARRAYDWGLVNELAAPEALLTRTLQVAALIGACPPANIARYVELTRRIEGMPVETSLAVEAAAVDAFRSGL